MQVLVTGGAGFIGSFLAERLLAEGHHVVCIDDFNAFYDPALKRSNVEACLEHERYELVRGDITDRASLEQLFDAHRVEAVVHLAAWAGVRPSIEHPEIYEEVNLGGTVNLLQQARRGRVGTFVFASSSSVYGGRTDPPFSEDDPVGRPVSPYAATKRAGELLCYTYHHLFGIDVTCLRYFTVYGPRQRPEMAIHKFTRLMHDGEPVPLYGDGTTSRDYTYIDDIVDGTMRALERCKGYEIVNLGGSKTTTLAALVGLIAEALGIEPRIERLPDQPGDVPLTSADVSKARKLLGYDPKVPVEVGVPRFVEWFLDVRRRGNGAASR